MNWLMPAETAPQDCIWMSFPREGKTLGSASAEREAGYAAWTEVANTIARFQKVHMVVDPSEMARAKAMLDGQITLHARVIDDFWMRDSGPTFVHATDGSLAAVDWIFNGWGGNEWTSSDNDRGLARFVAGIVGVPVISSLLVNEGGGIHVDGEGTIFVTDTVQLDPGRNPNADKMRVEEELARTLGVEKAIWFKQGLTRDYEPFGTRGHVDIVATMAAPGKVLIHQQNNPEHPDHQVMKDLRAMLEQETDAKGRKFEIFDMPAPDLIKDHDGYVDYSYINHLVTNDAIIACGYGEDVADARARDILAAAYGRQVVTVDARELFARGGGIHCITQQQPSAK